MKADIATYFQADPRVVDNWSPSGDYGPLHPDTDALDQHLTRFIGPYRRSMEEAGVVQRGAPVLRQVARELEPPFDSDLMVPVIRRLRETIERARRSYPFQNGIGISAPQIGLDLAVALVRPPNGSEHVLINPRILSWSEETTYAYEGCLSFFDFRGPVTRPWELTVRYFTPGGEPRIEKFRAGLARLVAHEVDHLAGLFYTDRMPDDIDPISVAEYQTRRIDWEFLDEESQSGVGAETNQAR